MIDLETMLAGFSVEEQREIAYFLSRYFKGSPYLEEEGKDIFAEVFDEPVSAQIREATENTIKNIEAEVGSAYEYDEATAQGVLDHITAFEESLTEEPTAKEMADASVFLKESKAPPT